MLMLPPPLFCAPSLCIANNFFSLVFIIFHRDSVNKTAVAVRDDGVSRVYIEMPFFMMKKYLPTFLFMSSVVQEDSFVLPLKLMLLLLMPYRFIFTLSLFPSFSLSSMLNEKKARSKRTNDRLIFDDFLTWLFYYEFRTRSTFNA